MFDAKKYKNIDKSSVVFLDDNNKLLLLNIQNQSQQSEFHHFQTELDSIQLFFSIQETCTIAFNIEHCAIQLNQHKSGMVYTQGDHTNILFSTPPNGQVICLLIPVTYFHSLFTQEENYLLNFNNFSVGKPIIEIKDTQPNLQVVLHQIDQKKENNPLNNLFLKAKTYELFSLYFSHTEENNKDNCPYFSNEDTLSQLKQAKNLVIEHMADPPSLEEIAKQVGLNIKKLKQGFKEVYGAPVFTFLLNYKLEYAKKLLLENNMNVNEIGLKVGYSTSSHFIAAFKRKFGITPKQFTKQSN